MATLVRNFGTMADVPVLRRVMMVGAEYKKDGRLSENDQFIALMVSTTLTDLGVPDAAWVDEFVRGNTKSDNLEVVNLCYGRDFRDSKSVTDIIIFCNIPLENSARVGPSEKDMSAWREALRVSGAKIACIHGFDSFCAEDMMGEDYIAFRSSNPGESFLMRRDYFEAIEDHLVWSKSPLSAMYGPYWQSQQSVFKINDEVREEGYKTSGFPYNPA